MKIEGVETWLCRGWLFEFVTLREFGLWDVELRLGFRALGFEGSGV